MHPDNYTREYYIAKFSAIPNELWTVGEFTDPNNTVAHCAYGHCGCSVENDESDEGNALDRLFRSHGLMVVAVNDGEQLGFNQATPKERILAALESFK